VRQVAAFVALTFALSWGAWGVAILTDSDAVGWRIAGTFGPTVAALLLAGAAGRGALGHLLSGFMRWRAPRWVWIFALVSTAVLGVAALWIHTALGGAPDWPEGRALLLAPVVFLWVLLFSVAGEETGWRGYLLPQLLDRTGAVRASIALGIVWALWHLPLWVMPGDFHSAIPMPLFVLQILAVSILYTWLWQESHGSLVIAHVFHAASNTTLGLLPLIPGEGTDTLRPLWIAVALLTVTAVVVARVMARRGCGAAS
jgi:membrane protease YdiL (CAAX protease family)